MNEVNINAVNIGFELAERVQPFLLSAPVVFITPIFDEALQKRQVRAVVPPRVGKLVRKARLSQAAFQVGQHGIRNLNFEWDDRRVSRDGACGGPPRPRRLCRALRVSAFDNGE